MNTSVSLSIFNAAEPPFTPSEPVIETLHSVEVVDPYRWLEDQDSVRTRQWLDEQTRYCRSYFESIPHRNLIRKRVSELLPAEAASAPWVVNGRLFFERRRKGDEQSVIVMQDPSGQESILVDPGLRGFGNKSAVAITAVSNDGRFLAYSIRNGGTDFAATEVFDVECRTTLNDRLPEGQCFGFVFALDNSGFYYCHESTLPQGSGGRVLFHRFGDSVEHDAEIFRSPERSAQVQILYSLTAKIFLYLATTLGKCRSTSVYMRTGSDGSSARLLLSGLEGRFMPFFVRNQLFALTDVGEPNFHVVCIDMTNASPTAWREIIGANADGCIRQCAVADDQIFVTRVHRFSTKLEIHKLDGRSVGEVPLASRSTVTLLNSFQPSDKLFFSCTSMNEPPAIYAFDPKTRTSSLWQSGITQFDANSIVVEEVDYPSKDGTIIPMFLAWRKDLAPKSSLPTFQTAYGGFGVAVTPRFTVFTTFLIEHGVLIAVPAIRGGCELGSRWHTAGKLSKRQDSFDDFISAAEWLVSRGWSVAKQLAIGGGSNAGLLVGAAMTQKPQLFRAVICLGPLLDMLRFQRFDAAAKWVGEYGSPDEEADFRWLIAYSPYHHVELNLNYPAVLLISGDADVRCNPMHARKMAARLQVASASGYPVLLDYKAAWGHMPVQPLSTKIDSLADRLAFLCHELGVTVSDAVSALC